MAIYVPIVMYCLRLFIVVLQELRCKGEGHVVHAGVNCVCNVCGSARSCGCVVNGSFARAAF